MMQTMENTDWFQFLADPLVSSSAVLSSLSTSTSDLDASMPIAETAAMPPAPAPPPQVPTPPASSHGSPTEEGPDCGPATIVSVSTTFYPGANIIPIPPDFAFLSSDSVFFYVHSSQVLSASTTRWKGLVPESLATPSSPVLGKGKQKEMHINTDPAPIISLPEPSEVLNVVLHTIYGMSASHYSPNAATVLAAAAALTQYGVALSKHAAQGTPFYELLLSQGPAAPLEFYTLAAQHGLQELAAAVSPHMLDFHLGDLTDEAADKMGAVYLKRMVFLHLGRVEALKRLLLPPPQGHAATPGCDFIEQKKLTRAWALASAYIAWDARADLSTVAIESALYSLNEHLTCELCKQALRERIKQLVVQWAMVKRTI